LTSSPGSFFPDLQIERLFEQSRVAAAGEKEQLEAPGGVFRQSARNVFRMREMSAGPLFQNTDIRVANYL